MTIQFRIIATLAALVALIAAGVGIHVHGVGQGKKIERAEWQDKEIQRQQAQNKLLLRHAEDMARTQLENDVKNRKVSNDYEQKLDNLRKLGAADRAAVDLAGGLRVSRAICDGFAADAKTASAIFGHEALARTVRLPLETEDDLWRLADDADEIVEQARACQNWIKQHGFYGEPE